MVQDGLHPVRLREKDNQPGNRFLSPALIIEIEKSRYSISSILHPLFSICISILSTAIPNVNVPSHGLWRRGSRIAFDIVFRRADKVA